MTPAPEPSAADLGWALLREGRWPDAREAFERAVGESRSAAALEGLSWAAWWLDEEPTVFAAREEAYRLYRQAGDAAAAAHMATWLAADELDFHGATAVASGWLGRARRLLEPVEPGAAHGWLAFMEGYVALASGDADGAGRLGAEAAALGQATGVADLEMLGLALEGSTLVMRARVSEGMSCLDEATAAAMEGDAQIPISSAWACCFLVSACTSVRDYERAFAWCDRIERFAERYASRFMLAFCRSEYAAVDMWRGRWEQADRLLQDAIEDFSRSRPALAGGALAALAELRRRQGRPDEARALATRAGGHTGATLCLAALALDAGSPLEAAELGERVLRQIPEHLGLSRLPALDLVCRASLAAGEIEAAREAASELRAVAAGAGTVPLLACADLADATIAAATGDPGRARALLEDAVDRFERCGAPYDTALARLELAGVLDHLGRTAEATRARRTARRALADLGAVVRSDEGGPAGVTSREREVLTLVADGLTNREIAERLVVSEHTVHRHMANILRKLGLPSRAAAAAHAIRAGLTERHPT